MRFVSTYSLQDAWRGRPQIAEIQVIPGEDNHGFRLILNETPYTGQQQAGTRILGVDTEIHFAPILPGANSFVLADKLQYCRMFYRQDYPAKWVEEWTRPYLFPTGIRIEMAPLAESKSSLQSGTVVVNLNATPDLNGYAD